MSTAPSVPPLQLTLVTTAPDTVIPVAGSVMVMVALIVHPFASVTVPVYDPAGTFIRS